MVESQLRAEVTSCVIEASSLLWALQEEKSDADDDENEGGGGSAQGDTKLIQKV